MSRVELAPSFLNFLGEHTFLRKGCPVFGGEHLARQPCERVFCYLAILFRAENQPNRWVFSGARPNEMRWLGGRVAGDWSHY